MKDNLIKKESLKMLRKVRTKNFQPAAERKCIDWKNETDLTRYCSSWKELGKSLNGRTVKESTSSKKDTKEVKRSQRFSVPEEITRISRWIITTSWEGKERFRCS